ncbi:MAG TPA: protein kinase [Blastocatellia bacterium]|nr:protein kinase [Blastocatellia bacterium]HMZ17275.1 protein kinase [Blastocatellia bacterium]HNG33336.1 protein kinase [Blastocatellia bacterium]
MTPERYELIGEIFDQALEFEPGEQSAFLLRACGGDGELREVIEKMLAQHRTGDEFLAQPALNVAATLLAQQPQVSLSGQTISRYKILTQLGAGGMGEVWLAEDTQLSRKVALKLLPDKFANEPANKSESTRRFETEAKAASATNHPNIVTIHEIGKSDGAYFIAQEYVEGETLRSRISQGPIPLLETLNIASQIANALAAAHAAGVVHRDIKPENVMVRHDGFVKVLDFGLARIQPVKTDPNSFAEAKTLSHHTAPGVILGTVSYMSPEQTRGEKLDFRSDQWSLGVVLYEMLTGHRPFDGNSMPEIFVAILERQPTPLTDSLANLPAQLNQILDKLLAKNSEQRYPSSAQLADELKRIHRRLELNAERESGTDWPDGVNNSSVPTSSSGLQVQNHKVRFAIIALILLTLVSTAAYLFLRAPAGVTTNNATIDSIAVLPFQNLSGNKDLTYLSDGLSQSLIDRLSELPQLKVISRNSSFKFREENIDVRSVAAQLGVRAILTGSVTQVGEDIVIRFDLTDATDDRHITGDQYQRKPGNILGVQHEIAQAVSQKLRLKLSASQSKRLVENNTENSEAYRYYLNGLVEMNGPQDVRGKALEYFEKAVSLDPDFAAAQVEISWIYVSRAIGSDNPQELMPKAKEAIAGAMATDPNLAKAHALLAVISGYEFDWLGAEKEYLRAIELNPNLDFTRNNYAFFLSVIGRHTEGLAELEQQKIRDPINRRLTLLQKGIILTQARRFDEALQSYKEAQAVEPEKNIPFSSLGYVYAGKGLYREAAEYYQKSVELLGGEQKYSQSLVYLAATYAKIPEKQNEARTILKRIETMSGYHSPAVLAAVYSALGDNNKAMELLEQAYLSRDPLLRYVGSGYEYDGLRADPRFQAMLKRLNLPE